jgi:predicted RNA-binding protein
MCLANIYRSGNGGKLLIKDIAYLKVDDNQIEMENLAGESKTLLAKINVIDFMNSDVYIDELAPESDKKLK